MSDAEPIYIGISLHLSNEDRALAVRHLVTPRLLSPEERLHALQVFNGLGASTVTAGGWTGTFAAFYREYVEGKYADLFLEQLLSTAEPEVVGGRVLRAMWQRIVSDLRTMGVQLSGNIGQQCLVAFCGYWWQAFGKGYSREVAVFRDLERSGIEFSSHDLRQRQERFSPYDLMVLGFRGDVKTSTYFLHTARSYPLVNDFYIVRIYDVVRRVWLDITMLKPAMWQAIDGDTTPCELDEVAQLLPVPLQIATRDAALVILTYEDWKQRILYAQTQAKGEAR